MTTVLDLIGLLLVVLACAMAAWVYVVPAVGVLVAGAGVLGVSWLADRRAW